MKAEIITVGTELLLGQIIDTNSAFIARGLAELGIDLHHIRTVGDNKDRLKKVLGDARRQTELIFITGGLGPTSDDITIQTIAEVWERELVKKEEAMSHLQDFYTGLGKSMPPSNEKQAYFPQGSRTVPNSRGTALGMILEGTKSTVVALPGVPNEMEQMFSNHILPYLEGRGKTEKAGEIIKSKVLRICGVGESKVQEKVSEFLKASNPTVAPLAKTGEVHLRITAKGKPQETEEMIESTENQLRSVLGNLIYGVDDQTLPRVVADLLTDHSTRISIAESSTGGLLASRISGAAAPETILDCAFVVPTNPGKSAVFDLPSRILTRDNKDEISATMAKELREKTGSDLSAVTGNVYGEEIDGREGQKRAITFGLATPQDVYTYRFQFPPGEADIRQRATKEALCQIYRFLVGSQETRTPDRFASGGQNQE